MSKFNKKYYLWYLITVCGFAIGLVAGEWFIGIYKPVWMEIFFWAFPAAGAGFGAGFGQWLLLPRAHKNAHFWIPITIIGVIANMGGSLLLLLAISEFSHGTLSSFFIQLPGWFVPLTIFSPLIILIGPIGQWLIIRDTMEQPFKELLKISIGWILAILSIFALVYMSMEIKHVVILTWLVFILIVILPGLIFAWATSAALKLRQ